MRMSSSRWHGEEGAHEHEQRVRVSFWEKDSFSSREERNRNEREESHLYWSSSKRQLESPFHRPDWRRWLLKQVKSLLDVLAHTTICRQIDVNNNSSSSRWNNEDQKEYNYLVVDRQSTRTMSNCHSFIDSSRTINVNDVHHLSHSHFTLKPKKSNAKEDRSVKWCSIHSSLRLIFRRNPPALILTEILIFTRRMIPKGIPITTKTNSTFAVNFDREIQAQESSLSTFHSGRDRCPSTRFSCRKVRSSLSSPDQWSIQHSLLWLCSSSVSRRRTSPSVLFFSDGNRVSNESSNILSRPQSSSAKIICEYQLPVAKTIEKTRQTQLNCREKNPEKVKISMPMWFATRHCNVIRMCLSWDWRKRERSVRDIQQCLNGAILCRLSRLVRWNVIKRNRVEMFVKWFVFTVLCLLISWMKNWSVIFDLNR